MTQASFYDVCISDACIFDVGYPELDKGKDGEEVYKVRKLNLRWPLSLIGWLD